MKVTTMNATSGNANAAARKREPRSRLGLLATAAGAEADAAAFTMPVGGSRGVGRAPWCPSLANAAHARARPQTVALSATGRAKPRSAR